MPLRVSLQGISSRAFIKCLVPGAALSDWDVMSDLQSMNCNIHYH